MATGARPGEASSPGERGMESCGGAPGGRQAGPRLRRLRGGSRGVHSPSPGLLPKIPPPAPAQPPAPPIATGRWPRPALLGTLPLARNHSLQLPPPPPPPPKQMQNSSVLISGRGHHSRKAGRAPPEGCLIYDCQRRGTAGTVPIGNTSQLLAYPFPRPAASCSCQTHGINKTSLSPTGC